MIHKILMTIMLMLCTVSTAFAEKKVPLKFETIGSQKGEIPELNIKWEATLQEKGENRFSLTLKITNEGEGTYILFGQPMNEKELKKNYMIKYDKFFSGDFEESQTQRKKQRVTTQTGNLRTNDPFKFLKQNETIEICYENIENEVSGRELKVVCYKAVTQNKKTWFGVAKEWLILHERFDISFSLDVKIPVLPPTPVRDLILEDLEKETTDLLLELDQETICINSNHPRQSDQKKPHKEKIENLKSKIGAAKIGKDNAEKYDELISRLENFKFKTIKRCSKDRDPHECGCGKGCRYCSMSWKELLNKINKIGTDIANAKSKEDKDKQKDEARRLKNCADKCKDRQKDSGSSEVFYGKIKRLQLQ